GVGEVESIDQVSVGKRRTGTVAPALHDAIRLRRFRRGRRNGAGAFALAIVLAARALTLAGVLAGAAVFVLLRRAAALALARVLAGAAVVAALAVAVALARV